MTLPMYNNSVNNVFYNQPLVSITSSYTVLPGDTIISVTSNVTQVTVTLPTPSTKNAGKIYYIKDAAGTAGSVNNIIITPLTGLIDGAASASIVSDFAWMVVYSDGINYYILDENSAFSWVSVAGTTQAMAADKGYYCLNAGVTTLSLPVANCVSGQIIAVSSTSGCGGWSISQGTGQSILFGNQKSTVGTSGSLSSPVYSISQPFSGDVVYLLCTAAATASAGTFQVINSLGNLMIS